MLMTRRKPKEQKEVAIYLNNKLIPQVHRLKYLVIILIVNLHLMNTLIIWPKMYEIDIFTT